MRILIAPDSFKGCLTAAKAAEAMARGIAAVFPAACLDSVPMADGGEGTVDALVAATGGTLFHEEVLDPLGKPVTACWGLSGDGGTAFVEMAAASGLTLLRENERNPLKATSYGTGQLIAKALARLHRHPCEGASEKDNPFVTQKNDMMSFSAGDALPDPQKKKHLIIGIGGSATNDGGAGALQALGISFTDAKGRELGFGAAHLARLAQINVAHRNPLLDETDISVACDVNNSLCGEQGASAVFGPQKGATPGMVAQLDKYLAKFAILAQQATEKDAASVPGAGAAGGLGAGLLFFTEARLVPGIRLVQSLTGFEERMRRADLVFTGEGQTDGQTAYGKVPAGIADMAARHGIPVICLSGAVEQSAATLHASGVNAIFGSASRPMSLQQCMAEAETNIAFTAEQICRTLKAGRMLAEKCPPLHSTQER